jgi:hypothetical protein
MYLKNKMRLLGMSALVGAGLVAATSANAYNVRLGGVDIAVDTIGSLGVSVRTASRDERFLPSGNGGFTDTRAMSGTGCSVAGITVNGAAKTEAAALNNNCYTATGADNYDGSINTDDGRLNFDQGDLTGGTLKFTSDISADFTSDLRGFARVNIFYDAVLSEASSYERGELNSDAAEFATDGIKLLDAYLDYNTELLGNPLQVRLGNQVINWGESTFFFGGNSVFNAIDVAAIRRPGAEIKEALLPVPALYASLALPFDLSAEAYVGTWDKFIVDAGGTPMANSDLANVEAGGAKNASNGKLYIGGSGYAGGNQMNCNRAGSVTAGMTNTVAIIDAIRAGGAGGVEDCTEASVGHFNTTATLGLLEAGRDAYGYDDARWDVINPDPDDEESYGLAVRWYSAALNSTEFGFYYQNYTSRIPYLSVESTGAQIGITTIDSVANNVTRQLVASGQYSYCDQGLSRPETGGPASTVSIGNGADDEISDPYNLFSSLQSYVNTNRADATPTDFDNSFLGMMNVNCAISPWDDNPVGASAIVSQSPASAFAATSQVGTGLGQDGTGSMMDLIMAGAEVYTFTSEHANSGTMFLDISPKARGILEYPSDIEKVGMSFNTTLLGWGVQGEASYSHNFPLQIDSDSLVISAFTSSCVFESLGAVGVGVYKGKRTIQGVDCNTTNPGVFKQDGWVREGIINFDLGTTATFTRSNPIIAALGADIGVLLTEFGFVYMEDMDQYRVADADVDGVVSPAGRLAGACTSGSDLGLGSLLGLDDRADNFCRPTSASAGALLLAQATWNNVLGTPTSLTPRFVYRTGLHGISPRPAGSFTEGVSSVGLSLGFEQQNWSGSLSYTDYQDDEDGLWSRNIDQDNVSISVSYAY